MIDFRRSVLAVCATAALASVSAAQTPNNLASVRGRVPTEADRRVITQWIAGQIETANTKEPLDLAAFRRGFLNELRASGATEQFREAFSDLSAEAFAKAIADPSTSEGPRALVCGMMLSILTDMNRLSALPAALNGLKHKSAFVRERAAHCLVRMRDRVPPAETQQVFDAVRTAAAQEGGSLALRAMYKALAAYGKPEDATKAIVAVLETRIPAYEKRDLRGCAADIVAAEVLAEMFTNRRAQLAAETQAAVQRLAELLTVAVLNLKEMNPASGSDPREPIADLVSLQLLVDVTERALSKAANTDLQQQSVAAQMKGPDAGRAERMQAALDRWIGTPQKPGVLNQQAFGLPAGLPKITLAPAPTTRAAPAPSS